MTSEGLPAAPAEGVPKPPETPVRSKLVIDSSVAIKWYVPEAGSNVASRLLHAGGDLLAPDLLLAELGNVLWKKVRRDELSAAQAGEIARALVDACPVQLWPSALLIEAALEIATAFERTVYDSLYLAMAIAEETQLITADERLVNALKATPHAERIRLLSDT